MFVAPSPLAAVFPFSVDQDRLSGAPDFSFLNHPLTAADRVCIDDGHFFTVGPDLKPGSADDTRVRFFGVSLTFGANFPDEADAPRIAKRLRKLGINLVRLHHLDSRPDRDPNAANSILTTGPYPTLNPVSVARLRHFLDCLKAEGIYADLNLHVGYGFRPEADHVPATAGGNLPRQSKPLHIFHPRLIALQQDYARKLIAALHLENDPVLAMIETDNETSLLQGWMRGQLDRLTGDYQTEFERQWHAYLKRDDVPLVTTHDMASPYLNSYLLFLADRDASYLAQMKSALRGATAWSVPMTGTQMAYGELLELDSQAGMDFQDDHFYVDPYHFPPGGFNVDDWRIRDADSSLSGTNLTAYINMAISRQAGKPYTISEYNQAWPDRQSSAIDPSTAAFAAFQDWDAIMHFAYTEGRGWDEGVPHGHNLSGDWAKFPNVGQAAWIFRTGAVRPGIHPIVLGITREMQLAYGRTRQPNNVLPYFGTTKFDPYLALTHPISMRRVDSGSLPDLPKAAVPYTSDTDELRFDPGQKLTRIQAPKAAGIFGFPRDRELSAGPLTIRLDPNTRGFAAILVTPLDDQPIADSHHLLISDPGCVFGMLPDTKPAKQQQLIPYPDQKGWWTLPKSSPDESGPSGFLNSGVPPAEMEQVAAVVTLRSSAKTLTVYPLDRAGHRLAGIAATRVSAGFTFPLRSDTPWYELAP